MRLLEQWLESFPPSGTILDLGCGSGSLPSLLAGHHVIGVDVDISAGANFPRVRADSHLLPFAAASFDLVICHHSLEHFHELHGTLAEIRRVLRPDGRLFVSVPGGKTFSDRLYRFLLCGGGHLQRFTFKSITEDIESITGLHLGGWKELSSSFIFVNRRNFLVSPRGPLPRRMRWAGVLPSWIFSSARMLLNFATRFADRFLGTRSSVYGWALAFTPEKKVPVQEPGSPNVCMFCGAGLDKLPERVGRIFYRCPYCSGINLRFGN